MKMKKTKKTHKGFSLIEVLVATFIFLVVMTAVVGVFARQSQNFAFLQVQQRNIENAQFAMNFVAKTLRTSTIHAQVGTNKMYVFDHSQGQCFRFVFDNTAGTFMTTSRPPNPTDSTSCSKDSWIGGNSLSEPRTGPYELTTGFTRGYFLSEETSRDTDPVAPGNQFRIGLITMRIEVADDNPASSRETWIQTSLSLRDYPGELKF